MGAGVNIPSLAKQSEIVEIFGSELFDIYREDKKFINEGLALINLFESTIERSDHPYYRNTPYRVEFIESHHQNFMTLLQLSLVYESNPRLSFVSRKLSQPFFVDSHWWWLLALGIKSLDTVYSAALKAKLPSNL